jgi:hypothetical protein
MRAFRTFRRTLFFRQALSLLAMTVLAGCGSVAAADVSGRAAPAPRSPTSPVRPALLVQVKITGGFVGPFMDYKRIPTVSVYADGQVVAPGPEPMLSPGLALPNLRLRTVSPANATRLAGLAHVALSGATDFGSPPIADATTTVFTLIEHGHARTVPVYALGEVGPDGLSLTRAQRANRARMRTLLEALTNLPRTLGTAGAGPDRRYRPNAIAALGSPWTSTVPAGARVLPWPGAPLPGVVLPGHPVGVECLNCAVSTGPSLARLLPVAGGATTDTLWSSRGRIWSVTFRPLLPDETGCESLGV